MHLVVASWLQADDYLENNGALINNPDWTLIYDFVESNEDMTMLRRNGDKSPAQSCEPDMIACSDVAVPGFTCQLADAMRRAERKSERERRAAKQQQQQQQQHQQHQQHQQQQQQQHRQR
ncbi:PREDICTED: KIN17-like protein [Trachymyrmex cornetzi]|uniref:KIN17-like protein n=1 Tax=Trachymyrmex cornetzi TaxID=471704 RepID=UPI00084F1F46|nr:PREDICTED: KIN17-like protein [Trachymyrmex cornetzi]